MWWFVLAFPLLVVAWTSILSLLNSGFTRERNRFVEEIAIIIKVAIQERNSSQIWKWWRKISTSGNGGGGVFGLWLFCSG